MLKRALSNAHSLYSLFPYKKPKKTQKNLSFLRTNINNEFIADWEATNEAIEEQVARESYLQWLRDNERRHAGNSKSATVTSADLRATSENTSPPRAKNLVEEETKAARSSPKPCCSHTTSEQPLQYLVS